MNTEWIFDARKMPDEVMNDIQRMAVRTIEETHCSPEKNDSILNYEERMWQLTEATKKAMPDLADAYYGSVKDAVYRDGAINLKTKRLMSLAVTIQAGCKDCMISQTSRALELGATVEEILETCSVAISMGGTLAWSKSLVVADYLREKKYSMSG
jgi:AhpD family alkylhydroperoxidase